MNLRRLAVLICLWGCFQTHAVFACRYNVRETGFIYLERDSYYFFGYISENTPEDIASRFKQMTHISLMNTNVEIEIINIDRQKDHPAMRYLNLWKIQSFPAAVLVSPDGQSLVLPFEKSRQYFEQKLKSTIDDIVFSSKRGKILEQVIETYGVVLLIEGVDVQENMMAKQAASYAIEKIKGQMKIMPKAIANPPVLIVMSPESFSQEKILLWSLGLDPDKISTPHAAVLYGRGRWIGPLLKGKEINENVLANILYVIGEDCECGLDWRLLQGTMLPNRWDDKMQTLVSEALGFDPENPMIKMEISQILKRGSSLYPGVPFGSQKPKKQSETDDDPLLVTDSKSTHFNPLYLIAVSAVLIITLGVFIVLRASRKNP